MCRSQYFWSGATSLEHLHFFPSVLLHLPGSGSVLLDSLKLNPPPLTAKPKPVKTKPNPKKRMFVYLKRRETELLLCKITWRLRNRWSRGRRGGGKEEVTRHRDSSHHVLVNHSLSLKLLPLKIGERKTQSCGHPSCKKIKSPALLQPFYSFLSYH